jgi:hypothetical protein
MQKRHFEAPEAEQTEIHFENEKASGEIVKLDIKEEKK